MQKVFVYCQNAQKEAVMHVLKVNNYKAIELTGENEVIFMLELYDCQINLLVKIMHDFKKEHDCDVSVHVCHKISYYE